MTLYEWLGLLGGASVGLLVLGRRCTLRAQEPLVLRGRQLRRREDSQRLRLVRPGRRSFRLPLLEVAHRLDFPRRVRTLVPYAYCNDGTPISFELRARLALSDDARALTLALPRLLRMRHAYLRALLESELDRAARAVLVTLSPRRAALRRGALAAQIADRLRGELLGWGLVTQELEASAPSTRPLPAPTPARRRPRRAAWRWRASARKADHTHLGTEERMSNT